MEDERLKELYNRRAICRYCIHLVSTVSPDDPLREGALAEYNRQLGEIDQQIAEITGEIPPIVIGLQPAQLFAKSQGIGGKENG